MSATSPTFDNLYPAVAAWMTDGGWVEIGYDDCQSSFIRVLDIGGTIWKGEDTYPSVDAALRAAEKAIKRWQKTHG